MNIAIIGCGYIGKAIAAIWHKQRAHHITATTQNPEHLDELAKIVQKSIVFKGNDENELAPLIENNELLLIAITANHREEYESAYLHTAQLLRRLALEMDMPRYLIYLGSTLVYGDHHGRWVDENSALLGTSPQAKILIDAEQIYLSLEELGWHVCTLRLAEVYGPQKELSLKVQQLEGQILPGSGRYYTNMIHQEDCASAIDYALKHELEGVFNLADDDHVMRCELYDQIANKFHLPKIQWDSALSSLYPANKRVSNHKIKAAGYTFKYPHRILV